jgi:hypothetical protein
MRIGAVGLAGIGNSQSLLSRAVRSRAAKSLHHRAGSQRPIHLRPHRRSRQRPPRMGSQHRRPPQPVGSRARRRRQRLRLPPGHPLHRRRRPGNQHAAVDARRGRNRLRARRAAFRARPSRAQSRVVPQGRAAADLDRRRRRRRAAPARRRPRTRSLVPMAKPWPTFSKGQLWSIRLDDANAKPQQLLQTRGSAQNLRWSPDGAHLAFVSDRDDHSFIAVYSVASGASLSRPLHRPRQQPRLVARLHAHRLPAHPARQGRAALRSPSHRAALVHSHCRRRHRQGPRNLEAPKKAWAAPTAKPTPSISCTGPSAIASSFPGSAKDGCISMPCPGQRRSAKPNSRPANFEVEHVSLSADRKTLVFDSNQNDIDRRHVWRVVASRRGRPPAPPSKPSHQAKASRPSPL